MELSLIELFDGHLDGQDVVTQTAVEGAAVPGGDGGALCPDQPPILQFGHILAHRVDAHPHCLSDGPVAGHALVGLSVLPMEEKSVDCDRPGGQSQGEDLVGEGEVVLDGITLGPVLFSHLAPPDCPSAHWMNFSFGTTIRLPTRSVGKPGSLSSS